MLPTSKWFRALEDQASFYFPSYIGAHGGSHTHFKLWDATNYLEYPLDHHLGWNTARGTYWTSTRFRLGEGCGESDTSSMTKISLTM